MRSAVWGHLQYVVCGLGRNTARVVGQVCYNFMLPFVVGVHHLCFKSSAQQHGAAFVLNPTLTLAVL